jgi:3-oxoacyl-[acyl-carrier protein] reductase
VYINLEGRVAIVTGAGRGIGRHLVRQFATEGVTTAALDVNEENLESLTAELAESEVPSSQFVCDVTDLDRVQEVVDETVRLYGRIDILVNNAGVVGGGPVESLPVETWQFCQDVNLTGTFLMCKAVVPVMKKQRSGRIINASVRRPWASTARARGGGSARSRRGRSATGTVSRRPARHAHRR